MIDLREHGEKLIDQINREEAEKEGLNSGFFWQKVRQGLDDKNGMVRLGHLKILGEYTGMKPADKQQVQHDFSAGLMDVAIQAAREVSQKTDPAKKDLTDGNNTENP